VLLVSFGAIKDKMICPIANVQHCKSNASPFAKAKRDTSISQSFSKHHQEVIIPLSLSIKIAYTFALCIHQCQI
jgi:hypothetical protein